MAVPISDKTKQCRKLLVVKASDDLADILILAAACEIVKEASHFEWMIQLECQLGCFDIFPIAPSIVKLLVN